MKQKRLAARWHSMYARQRQRSMHMGRNLEKVMGGKGGINGKRDGLRCFFFRQAADHIETHRAILGFSFSAFVRLPTKIKFPFISPTDGLALVDFE